MKKTRDKYKLDVNNPIIKERLTLIIKDLKHGLLGREIADKYSAEWGLETSYLKNYYITTANKLIKDDVESIVAELRHEQLTKYLELYKIAMENGQIKTANMVLNSIDKLYSLQVQKVEANIKNIQIDFD